MELAYQRLWRDCGGLPKGMSNTHLERPLAVNDSAGNRKGLETIETA